MKLNKPIPYDSHKAYSIVNCVIRPLTRKNYGDIIEYEQNGKCVLQYHVHDGYIVYDAKTFNPVWEQIKNDRNICPRMCVAKSLNIPDTIVVPIYEKQFYDQMRNETI